MYRQVWSDLTWLKGGRHRRLSCFLSAFCWLSASRPLCYWFSCFIAVGQWGLFLQMELSVIGEYVSLRGCCNCSVLLHWKETESFVLRPLRASLNLCSTLVAHTYRSRTKLPWSGGHSLNRNWELQRGESKVHRLFKRIKTELRLSVAFAAAAGGDATSPLRRAL